MMEMDDNIFGCDYCSNAISPVTIYFSEMTKEDERWNISESIEVTYEDNGSTISGNGKYQLTTDIPSEFVCKFEITDAVIGEEDISPSFVVGDISFTKQEDLLKIGQGDGKDYSTNFPQLPIKCKVDVSNSAIVYIYDNVTGDFVNVGDWKPNSNFIGVNASGGSITLKNVKIYTKSKGGVTATGDMEIIEGLANAKQSILNQLLTEKGTYPSIDDDYGSEIYEVLGEDYESATVEALQIYIQNALLENPRVKEISRIEPHRTLKGELNILLTITLVNGTEDTINLNISELGEGED